MDIPLRVLIIEDSDRDVALEVRALEAAGYRVTSAVVDTAAEMKAAMAEQVFDIVISDHGLPQFDAPGALDVLKQSGLDIPFIVVSGSIGEKTAVALMKAGAHDYVMKDKLLRLVPAVQRGLREAESRRERKRAEEALRSERTMLARTEGIAHVGSWEWDIATDKVIWSDELFRIVQRDPREGAPSFSEHPAFYHPDDMARLRQAVEAAVADGTPYELELRAIRKDGETRMCVARGVAELALDGRPVRLFGSLQDITERLRVKEALKESEEKYRNIFENSMEGIYQSTPEGRFITVNGAFARMAGYDSPEELIESIEDIGTQLYVHPEDYNRFLEVIATRGIVEGFEVDFYKKNGSPFWVVINARAVKDEQGEILYSEGLIEDITLRKHAEKKLLQTLDSLRKAFSATVQVLVSAVEARDPYTAGHQIRSANLALAIATEMGLPQDRLDGIRMAGSIHDIGKLSVPAEILSKPTKLSELEFALIKEHARQGYEILKDVESSWPLAEMVYQHHERMDGSGYPRHLKGEEICIEARIMAVADVVEAMASHRPYRPALGIGAALEEIEKNKETLYDHAVADACLRLFRQKGFQLKGPEL